MSHQHSHHLARDINGRNLLITIILNILITAAQIIGGLMSGSLSLLSDALHNFSDVLSLLISFIANKLVKKKASFSKTFGYKRAEILAAFINASTLIIVAIILIKEAVMRFLNPETITTSLVIWLSIIAILGNGFSVLLLRANANKNMNIKSAYLHLLTDMLASIAVLVGGLLMKYYQMYWVDSLLTLLIALYLIWVGLDLLKSSTKMLMLFTPDRIDISELVQKVNQLPQVKLLHHVHIWNLSDDELHLEAHLDLNNNITMAEFNRVLSKIEAILRNDYHINHVTIQPEFNKADPKSIIVQD